MTTSPPTDLSGAGLDALEERATTECFLHVSHALALIEEVRRLRGMMAARAKGDCPELPCSNCGARVDHVGIGCRTCNDHRLGRATVATPCSTCKGAGTVDDMGEMNHPNFVPCPACSTDDRSADR